MYYNEPADYRQQELDEQRQYHHDLANLQCAVNVWRRCAELTNDILKQKAYRLKYEQVKSNLNKLTGVKK